MFPSIDTDHLQHKQFPARPLQPSSRQMLWPCKAIRIPHARQITGFLDNPRQKWTFQWENHLKMEAFHGFSMFYYRMVMGKLSKIVWKTTRSPLPSGFTHWKCVGVCPKTYSSQCHQTILAGCCLALSLKLVGNWSLLHQYHFTSMPPP